MSRKNAENVEEEAGEPAPADDGLEDLKGTFTKEVAYMMYAFGDDDSSLIETVDVMEDLVIDYASGILKKALDVASLRSRSAVKATVSDADILTVVKQDPKKYDRLLELQRLKEELENTRQIDGTGDTQRELVVTKEQTRSLAGNL